MYLLVAYHCELNSDVHSCIYIMHSSVLECYLIEESELVVIMHVRLLHFNLTTTLFGYQDTCMLGCRYVGDNICISLLSEI